jgi:tyrosinase
MLPEFLMLQLDVMPLVAPLTTTCCSKSDTKGRGARSALIRGQRGLSPFDGKQVPRRPWGGSPVSDQDICRIETWDRGRLSRGTDRVGCACR